MPAFKISKVKSAGRKFNPTQSTSTRSLLDVRRNETFEASSCIHGASSENTKPVLFGMYDTICSSEQVENIILDGKISVVNSIKKRVRSVDYQNDIQSYENISRSLSVYYSHNVMGKEKYLSLRKANRNANKKMNRQVNYVPYPLLSTTINNIDIGILNDIHPGLTYGLPDEEIGEGNYRCCKEYIPHLAKFYLCVDAHRKDKLQWFPNIERKDTDSKLFCIAGVIFYVVFFAFHTKLRIPHALYICIGTIHKVLLSNLANEI